MLRGVSRWRSTVVQPPSKNQTHAGIPRERQLICEGVEEASGDEFVGGPVDAEHENGATLDLASSRAPAPLFSPSLQC